MKLKLLAPALFLLAAASSQGALVLTINIANPSAVVITGVANNSAINGTLKVNFDGGISLLSFFTANENLTTARTLSGNWKAAGAAAAYNEMVTFAFGNSAVVPGVDLSIYNLGAPVTDFQTLTTSAPPFTGSSTVNLSGLTRLPAVGATGNVNLGFLASHGGTIGTWVVVPEPSTALLGLLGTFTLLRRRRRFGPSGSDC